MTIKRTFSSQEVKKLTGLAYHKIDYAARAGIIVPSDNVSTGTGDPRRYTLSDVIALRAMKELQECGLPARHLKKIVGYLREIGSKEPVLSRKLIVTGGANPDVLFVETDDEFVRAVSALKAPGQVILKIGELASEVQAEIAEIMGSLESTRRAEVA